MALDRPVVPAQIGVIVDSLVGYTPGVGPLFTVLGFGLLTVWFLDRRLFVGFAPYESLPRSLRAIVTAGMTIGLVFVFVDRVLRGGTLSTVLLIYLVLGKFIEGAVAVHVVRRVQSVLHSIGQVDGTGWVAALLSPTRIIVVLVVPLGAILLTAAVLTDATSRPSLGNATVVWTVSVGALAASGLLWDLRLSLTRADAVPVQALGLLFCVLGAELYNFGALPPQVVTATEAFLRWLPLVELAPLTQRLLTNTALVLVGQVAFVVGVVIALMFLWSHEASRGMKR